jgi:hypothetical protein
LTSENIQPAVFKSIPIKATNGRSSKVSRSDFSELSTVPASSTNASKKRIRKSRFSKDDLGKIKEAYTTDLGENYDADRLLTPEGGPKMKLNYGEF